MKDERDPGTLEMTLPAKRNRGRPATGKAKSAAERMRAYRARSVTVDREWLQAAMPTAVVSGASFHQVQDRVEVLEAEVGRLNRLLEVVSDQLKDAGTMIALLDNAASVLDEDTQGYLNSLLGAVETAMYRLSAETSRNVTKKG